jgi:phosphatidylinositol phospholipase C delta
VSFDCIREIRRGQNTKAFELHGKDLSLESRSFSVVYFDDVKYGTLNFIARSDNECLQWCSGLLGLLKRLESVDDSDPLQNQRNISKWLLNIWNQVDLKSENVLDLDRCLEVCRKLNVALSKSELKSAFKNALILRSNCIPFEEFERLYCNLRFRNDISDLFSRLCKSDPAGLTFSEFQQFVLNEQKVFTPINVRTLGTKSNVKITTINTRPSWDSWTLIISQRCIYL